MIKKFLKTNKTVVRNSKFLFSKNFPKLNEETHKPVYFDFQATTPLDPRALDAMMPYLVHDYGNPHSRTHEFGWMTEKAVENARKVI